jgi:hypothetical protein
MTGTINKPTPAGEQMQGSKDGRYRHWALLVYPESAPSDWEALLDAECIPWVKSPLHDSDVWTPDDERQCAEHTAGSPKKAHWHVALMFSGKVGALRVKAIADKLHAPYPKPINDIRAMVRYFAHLDSPEKHQYNTADIEAHCGADVFKYLQMSDSEEDEALNTLEAVILENEVTEYFELFRGYGDNPVMKRVIRSHSYHLCQLIRSIREYKRTYGRSIYENGACYTGEQGQSGAAAEDDCGGVQDDEA